MLPHYQALTGGIARRLALSIPVLLLAACAWDLTDPVGPEGEAESSTSALATVPPARQATNLTFGDFALHVPANVEHVRGILIALGGPDTRGFAAGTPFGAPFPPVEAALQDLGARFRALAAERGLAVLGSGRFGASPYPDEPASDQALLDAVAQAAALTGHPELLHAPIILYGMSGGGPEATGFTQRNPERVAALFLKAPASAGPLTGRALEVPAYMMLAGMDAFVDNVMLTATFAIHRAAGAPWALALEPGVPHHSLSTAQRELTVEWLEAILPLSSTAPSRPPLARMGWLGDPATGEIAPVQAFGGDPASASWFPKRRNAGTWASIVGF